MTIQEAIQSAVAHHNAGRFPEAEALYRQVLTTDPNQPDALHLLGVLAFQCNHLEPAQELISRAIAIYPTDPNFHYNLGHVLAMAGKRPEAVESYSRAIALRPDHSEAYNNMGVVLNELGRYADAITTYQKALELNPTSADTYCNLSNAYRESNQIEQALAAAQKAYELQPEMAAGHNNLGAALLRNGRFEEAMKSYRRAIELEPNFAMAHYNLAMALLMNGRLEEGWPHAEWRWKAKELNLFIQNFPQPMWDGSPLAGRRILLHAEQGYGDAIHLVRYVPDVVARGGKVILAVPKGLVELMKNLPGIEALVTDGDELPPFDVQCTMLSLPLLLKTALDTIPAPIPYLHADPALAEAWRKRMDIPGDTRKKIGLVWAGRPEHKNDSNRSILLSMLAPLAGLSNARFISLQKGDAARQAQNPPPEMKIESFGEDLQTFADSAGLIANLDLLITVDTAPAHLAGAMGKPVWMLVPFIPDWRWMLNRDDSPWYPTMTLFRQPKPRDWTAPIARLAESLKAYLETR